MRNARRRILRSVIFLCSLGVAATGCVPLPPPGVILVTRRPPGDRVELMGVAPGPGYVWAGGYWRWDGGDYGWVPGHWVLAERGHERWVPGRWRHARGGWYYVEGYWR